MTSYKISLASFILLRLDSIGLLLNLHNVDNDLTRENLCRFPFTNFFLLLLIILLCFYDRDGDGIVFMT